MTWKTAYRSFYYDGAPEPDDPVIDPARTAFLVIDVQNTYVERPDRDMLSMEERRRHDAWTPFHDRLTGQVIPRTAAMLDACRARGIECLFARIACHKENGRDRSLSQKLPGWNNLLLPKSRARLAARPCAPARRGRNRRHQDHRQRADRHQPPPDPHQHGIETVVCAGIFTDQCVSSTVRSLADESFRVIVSRRLLRRRHRWSCTTASSRSST